MLDIFYLTYKDDFSQTNLDRIHELSDGENRITHVKDIDGIYAAHKHCASLSETDHFFVVDGDAYLMDSFNIGYVPGMKEIYDSIPAYMCTHVWRAKNPVNGLIYGYGGVKLFVKKSFDSNDNDVVDMTTTVAKRGYPYYPVDAVSNITCFNTSPYATWRSAFRECAKLASGMMEYGDRQKLDRWLTPLDDADFREDAISGARFGMAFGEQNKDNKDQMKKLNDWRWLEEFYKNVVEET